MILKISLIFLLAMAAMPSQASIEHPYQPASLDYAVPCWSTAAGKVGLEVGRVISLTEEPFYIPPVKANPTYLGFDQRWGKTEDQWRKAALDFAESPLGFFRERKTKHNHLIFKATQKEVSLIEGLKPAFWLLIAVKQKEGQAASILVFHEIPEHLYGFDSVEDFLAELALGELIALGPADVLTEMDEDKVRSSFAKQDRQLFPDFASFINSAIILTSTTARPVILRVVRSSSRVQDAHGVASLKNPTLEVFSLENGAYAKFAPGRSGQLELKSFEWRPGQDVNAPGHTVGVFEYLLRRTKFKF